MVMPRAAMRRLIKDLLEFVCRSEAKKILAVRRLDAQASEIDRPCTRVKYTIDHKTPLA